MVTSRPLVARRRCRRPRRRRAGTAGTTPAGERGRLALAQQALHERAVRPPAGRPPASASRSRSARGGSTAPSRRSGRAAPRSRARRAVHGAQVREHPPPAAQEVPDLVGGRELGRDDDRALRGRRQALQVAGVAGDHRVLRQRAEVPTTGGVGQREPRTSRSEPARITATSTTPVSTAPSAALRRAPRHGRRGHAGDRDREQRGRSSAASASRGPSGKTVSATRASSSGAQTAAARDPRPRARGEHVPRRPQQHRRGDREERDQRIRVAVRQVEPEQHRLRGGEAEQRRDRHRPHLGAQPARVPPAARAAARAPRGRGCSPARGGRTRCGSGAGSRAATTTKKCSPPCAPNSGYAARLRGREHARRAAVDRLRDQHGRRGQRARQQREADPPPVQPGAARRGTAADGEQRRRAGRRAPRPRPPAPPRARAAAGRTAR